MGSKHINTLVIGFIIITAFVRAAQADIGKVGGIGKVGAPKYSNDPSTTSNVTPPEDEVSNPQKSESTATQQEQAPLLDIPFSQKRVNFERSLDKTIGANEKLLPGGSYTIEAIIPKPPANGGQQSHASDIYSTNLNDVMQAMQNAGVTSDRIHTKTTYKDGITFEDIAIYKE